MANLDRFLRFSAAHEKHLFGKSEQCRKLRKAIKRRKAKVWAQIVKSTHLHHHYRTVLRQIEAGLKMLKKREANLPAYSQPPAQPLCVANLNGEV